MISDATPEAPSKLDRVLWLKKRHYIDERGAWAADCLLADNESAERTYPRPSSGVGRSRATSPIAPQVRISEADARIEAARAVLGEELTQILTLVVIENTALPEAAEIMGIHPKAAIPLVRAALQVLAGHYLRQRRL